MRSGSAYGDPREAVGPEKERRLRRAAEAFLARNGALTGLEVAFEVAAALLQAFRRECGPAHPWR
jgi:Holliday junction resolvase-like predicted endonuclease